MLTQSLCNDGASLSQDRTDTLGSSLDHGCDDDDLDEVEEALEADEKLVFDPANEDEDDEDYFLVRGKLRSNF